MKFKSNARKEAEARAQAIANRAARRIQQADAIAAGDAESMVAYATNVATYYRCNGCGGTFKGERGLRSHQTRKHVAASCDARWVVK